MPTFFIERPIFAWVVAILIALGGVLAILNLGVESYPNVAPPSVTVSATYPGASADTTEKNVTQVIERSEEHTSELQSLMRISYAVFCLKKKKKTYKINK